MFAEKKGSSLVMLYVMCSMVMLLLFGVTPAYAADTEASGSDEAGNYSWMFSEGTLTITPTDVTKPAIVGNRFKDQTDITSVIIAPGVEQITNKAFRNCTNLSHVDLGSVKKIEANTFIGAKLTDVGTIPPGCEIANGTVFPTGCLYGVTDFYMNAGNNGFICNSGFGYSCSYDNGRLQIAYQGSEVLPTLNPVGLKFVLSGKGVAGDDVNTVVFKNVANIPSGFSTGQFNCPNLESVTFGAETTEIGIAAFENCSKLASVEFAVGSKLATIGSRAFVGCTSLASLDLSTTQLACVGSADGTQAGDGTSPFQGCTALTEVKLPEALETVGGYAFNGCTALTSVYVPKNVTSVLDNAFQTCSALKTVFVPASLGTFSSTHTGLANNEGIEIVVYGGSAAPECLRGDTIISNFDKVTVTVPEAVAEKIDALDVTADNYADIDADAIRGELADLSAAAKSVLDNPELLEAKLDVADAKVAAFAAKAEAVQAAKDACEAAGISYDADKSVAENVAAAKTAVEAAAAAASAAEQKAAEDACKAAGIAYDTSKTAAENLAAANKAAEQAVADAAQAQTDLKAAKAAQSKAEADLKTAQAAQNGSSADLAAAKAAQAAAEKRLAAVAKSVKTVTVNVKTVTAAAIAKAIKAVGGDAKYVTTIVLGSKVKTVKASAFKALKKVKTLQVQTKKLTKKSVKGSLKSSKVSKVVVNVEGAAAHEKLVKKYKKIFTKANAGKKAKVK